MLQLAGLGQYCVGICKAQAQPRPISGTAHAAFAALHECTPQNLSNILWAYATLEYYPGAWLLDAAAQHQLSVITVRACMRLRERACVCVASVAAHVRICASGCGVACAHVQDMCRGLRITCIAVCQMLVC